MTAPVKYRTRRIDTYEAGGLPAVYGFVMMKTLRSRSVLLLLAFVLAGCEQAKSSNPLSPALAGPIAGVTVTSPKQLDPGNGGTIQDKEQPITLLIENPSSNSPRPVTLRLQIAVDTGFTNVVYSREGLQFGESGRTTHRLPDKLQSGRTYYWRTAAGDGADDSGWSPASYFVVLNPVVIGVPDPQAPIANARASSKTPELVVTNGQSSGPHGTLTYYFQVADNSAFAPTLLTGSMYQDSTGRTGWVTPELPLDQTLYWRVRISDGTDTGAWSRVESFRSFLPPPVIINPPTPGPSPPSGNWQACAALVGDKPGLVACVHAVIHPVGVEGAFEVTKRVAWLLRGEGGGLMIKNGGENIVFWRGYSFSAGRMMFSDGHYVKILTDVGGANGPGWSEQGPGDITQYVPAMDPSLPLPEPVVSLEPAGSLWRAVGQDVRNGPWQWSEPAEIRDAVLRP
jgi:hypothetical protein